jgi:hypothetical protein
LPFLEKLPALDARRRQSGRLPIRAFPIELRITSDELARLDMLSAKLGAPRWRVIRLALHMLFEQERATSATDEGRIA